MRGNVNVGALDEYAASRYYGRMNPFTRHPSDVGETYFGHARTALWFGLRMTAGGLACFVHAVFPFLFERSGSRTVKRLNREVSGRTDKADWERHPII